MCYIPKDAGALSYGDLTHQSSSGYEAYLFVKPNLDGSGIGKFIFNI